VGVAVAQEGGAGGAAMEMPAWMLKGKEHETLKKFVGTWDVSVMGMPGKTTSSLILDNCFLEHKFEMAVQGQAFEGRMIMGYDTLDKEWVAIWIDSSKPIFSISRGTEKDGVITFKSNDPSMSDASGKRVPCTMTLKWTDANTYVLEMFEGETKTMEIVYKKKA
jgi:hypothetical protein